MKESEIENNNLASTALGRVQPYLAQGDYAKALYGDSAKTIRGERIIGLIELVDNYGSTKTGKVAALYAGNALFTNGEADKAIDYYEMALESTSKTIIMGANAGMATCYEHKGEYQTAADYYEKAAQLTITPDVALRYKYFMGLCYEKAGATSDAEKVYREIIRENEYSDYADYAKSSLIRIGTIIE